MREDVDAIKRLEKTALIRGDVKYRHMFSTDDCYADFCYVYTVIYVARVRNGFVLASRRQVFERIRHLVSSTVPFANLPDTHKTRWGDELTAEKMKECIWLRPEAVAQIEFLEWTAGDRLRHSKSVGLREDKGPRQVVKER